MPRGVYPRPDPRAVLLGRIEPDLNGGCWLWSGTLRPDGYGVMGTGRCYYYVHRLSWELLVGEIPSGLLVCHKCDVRACINPAHLFLGDHHDNNSDAFAKGRREIRRGEEVTNAKLSDDLVRRLRADPPTNRQLKEMAKHIGVSRLYLLAVVAGRAWRHIGGGETAPIDRHRGSEISQSKLTEDAVRAIRSSPHTNAWLAEHHGVSRAAISLARNRLTWRHVP